MEYKQLGRSDLNVSRIALGTMTFGRMNTEAESFEQMDYALSEGVNFFDTAEMYPVPTDPAYQGLSEAAIGKWLKARGCRDRIVLASKAAGPGEMVSYLRDNIRFDRANLTAALEASLNRLQTDYLDLYQLHWPDRDANFFGKLGYQHHPENDGTPIAETLEVLGDFVKAGKIRYIGLSNETAWGTMTFLREAEKQNLPAVVSVQNPYSLLNRTTEVGLAEVMLREQVDLLAYSPLGFGVLSGKYLDGQLPEDSRLARYPQYNRYVKEQGVKATEAYVFLAREHGLDPAQMALAFVNSRPFLGSNIIGATKLEQLKANIASVDVTLSDEVMEGIEAIHRQYTYPCP